MPDGMGSAQLATGFAMLIASFWLWIIVIPATNRRMDRLVFTQAWVEPSYMEGIPRLRYSDAHGNTIIAMARVGRAQGTGVRPSASVALLPGQQVWARYDPEHTDWVIVDGYEEPTRVYALIAAVLLVFALMLFLFHH